MPNEPVEKVLLTSENDVFGGHLTLPKYEIVDCGAFYEVTFFCISPKNLLGHFFYSLNGRDQGREKASEAPLSTVPCIAGLEGTLRLTLPYVTL